MKLAFYLQGFWRLARVGLQSLAPIDDLQARRGQPHSLVVATEQCHSGRRREFSLSCPASSSPTIVAAQTPFSMLESISRSWGCVLQ